MPARPISAAWVATLLLLVGCGGSAAGPDQLSVTGAWARTTPPGAVNGVVYFDVAGPEADAIVGVEVPADVAAEASLHETVGGSGGGHSGHGGAAVSGDMTSMRPIASVPIPPGKPVRFVPGARHVMLTDLADELALGEEFTLTVRFASGAVVEVPVVVADNPPSS